MCPRGRRVLLASLWSRSGRATCDQCLRPPGRKGAPDLSDTNTPAWSDRAPKSWEQRYEYLTAAIIAGAMSFLVLLVRVCIAGLLSDETDTTPQYAPTVRPGPLPTATAVPTAIPTPSPTWKSTVVPTRTPPPSDEDLETAKQMFDYTVSQMPVVLGVGLTREGSAVRIFVEISRGFDLSLGIS